MVPPGFPLPLRNALAELALAACDDPDSAAALAWLAGERAPLSPAAAKHLARVHLVDAGSDVLLDVHAPHADAASAHAARALRAVAAVERDPAADACARACRIGAALWNEHLFFEVHEVLEAVWKNAAGDTRQALQGVIQIAVAFHHLAHGNRRGARSLLAEGRARLASVSPATLPALDVAALLADTAAWETALAERDAMPGDPPPLRTARR
jgi:hypothetical protein